MAEALFNQLLGEENLADQYQAESAATWGMDGLPAAADGQWVMRDRGLDISAHCSREVTPDIIREADLVLAMESGHVEALRFEFPFKADQIYLLSEMAGPPYDVDDPYGRGVDRFERTAQELEDLLKNGLERILELAGGNG
jgi:protein-tyrosine phosphatase